MCSTCGCGADEIRIEGEAQTHAPRHDHGPDGGAAFAHGDEHAHVHVRGHGSAADGAECSPAAAHAPGLARPRMLRIEQDILAKNDAYAAQNRKMLEECGIFALNFVSSPGSGKTALLVKTIEALGPRLPICVIEGDQQTSRDAERIRATGARAVQINTGKGCHLDAHMVGHALERLAPPPNTVVMIENVGNLVCPAAFDLGEAHKVVVVSVTEGEDKPLKYPDMFRRASLMLLNKIDLLPYLDFDIERCIGNAQCTNPAIGVIGISAVTGAGLSCWLAWLEQGAAGARAASRQAAMPEFELTQPEAAFAGSAMR